MFQILLTVLIFSAISKRIVKFQCIQKVLVFQNDSKHSQRDGMLQWCFKTHRYSHKYFKIIFKCIYANTRDQSRYAPNQWGTSLQYNDVSHWLGTHLDISGNNSKCIYSNVYHCRSATVPTAPQCLALAQNNFEWGTLCDGGHESTNDVREWWKVYLAVMIFFNF